MDWIECSERLPEGECLVICEGTESWRGELRDPEVHVASYHQNITIIGGHFEFDMPKVTHWMPLPEPPS